MNRAEFNFNQIFNKKIIRHIAGTLSLPVEIIQKILRSDIVLIMEELKMPVRLVLTEILLRHLLIGFFKLSDVEKDFCNVIWEKKP